ncbi:MULTISPECIES: beta-ketoacyl synthase N-terminal-like domain-containing protein [unclassified Streptomyces]|uniref:beta-ketoacyl synthase N-terminal-like domain-containing protein n=1 Tax=unclassified Streptomyces TaxID=2593676 RepID=UPI0024B9250C|nr:MULTISPECIES: beta-ketoacyl synthase N-terminal-like domain-containing protein [unclassified Streptomyces]MDJ0346537.1 beta-ketoacyl synthase N-terminal-like domain-containing protein [Streptomyces sp. PH10-H1]
MITCVGGLDDTFEALLAGRSGVSPLRCGDPDKLNVRYAYSIDDADAVPAGGARLAGRWLARCVREALDNAGVDPAVRRVAVIVGTGMREHRAVEQWHADGAELRLAQTHFAEAVRSVAPGVTEVHTLANACAASGYALALAADLLELGEADAVVAAGCDTMTESMLTMIGRVGTTTADTVRPFDANREGVLLGEGAVAVVVERTGDGRAPLGLLRGVGLGCDAHHETAPDLSGIVATMRDAHRRAGVTPEEIGLVLAHGTATGLNDPTEAAALLETFGPDGPPVTAIKGAIGHTSGGAALMSVLVALRAMGAGVVPPVVGLRTPIAEAEKLNLVHGQPLAARPRMAQVNAFGFGGVNAVVILEACDA